MFEQGKGKEIGNRRDSGDGSPKKDRTAPFNWASLPVTDLIRYRDEITAHLPALSLAEINMEEELLLQYHALRKLQNDCLEDNDTPLNQRSQLANSVSTVLTKLAERQEAVYTSERLKAIERVLIDLMKKQPVDLAEAFINDYKMVLEGLK